MNESRIIIGDANKIDLSLFPYQEYGVIVADPPWEYDFFVANDRSIQAQYPVMDNLDICNMGAKIKKVSNNTILLLWGTWPKLPQALEVMEAWGFEYLTGFPWIKLNKSGHGVFYGMGHWVRGCSEFVFIGRRGDVPPPKSEGFLGLMSPVMQHSKKPDSIYQIAEAIPGPYLEIFARRSRLGWTSFGNDITDMTTGKKHGLNEEEPYQTMMGV